MTKSQARAEGVTSGVERAKSIARGDLQPAQDLRDFFSRFAGTYRTARARQQAWEQSKILQAWDLWGGEPMRIIAEDAMSRQKSPARNPEHYLDLPPTAGVDVRWSDDLLEELEPALADPQMKVVLGARVMDLLRRLKSAPRREKYWMRVVTPQDLGLLAVPGAREGWYLDTLSERWCVEEEDGTLYLEVPHPAEAFTLGEMVELEFRLGVAAEHFADAADAGLLAREQRKNAVIIAEGADELRLRLALKKLQFSPEEEVAAKRKLLEVIAEEDE